MSLSKLCVFVVGYIQSCKCAREFGNKQNTFGCKWEIKNMDYDKQNETHAYNSMKDGKYDGYSLALSCDSYFSMIKSHY